MRRTHLVAAVSGLLFAIGLSVSGMTDPGKVIAFLDVTGDWDPRLAFVMLGAIGAHLPFALRARRADAKPLLAASFALPTSPRIDAPLLIGAALFGLGWGAAGFCPGPALVALVTLWPTVWLFVAAMLAGMLLHRLLLPR